MGAIRNSQDQLARGVELGAISNQDGPKGARQLDLTGLIHLMGAAARRGSFS